MAQPSGQLLLSAANASEYFFYAQGAGMWDARNGAMLAKTGTGAVTSESGANVVNGDGETYYTLAAAIALAGEYTLGWKARATAANTASMVFGNRATQADFIWLNNGSNQTAIRAGNDTKAFTNTGSTTLNTYHLTKVGTNLNFYINGVLASTNSQSTTFTVAHILSGYSGGSYSHNGVLEYLNIVPGVALDAVTIASRAADPYQILAVSGSLTITTPVAYKMHQRNGSNISAVAISGTYTGTPTSIEARFKGGAWTTLVAAPAGGTFAGSLNCGIGQGAIEVRFSTAPAITASVAMVGVGDIYIVAGQSNNAGRATSKVDPVASAFTAVEYDRSGNWIPLQEATTQAGSFDGGTSAAGSYLGQLSNLLQANGIPVAFVPYATGSTYIYDWARYDPNPFTVGTGYGQLYLRAQAVGSHRAMIWWQGESEANNNPNQAAYTAALNLLINNWFADTGQPTFVIKIANYVGGAATIRAAQDAVIAGNSHVSGSADGNVYSGGVHYVSTTDINNVAAAVYAGMVAAFYSRHAQITLVNNANTPQAALTGLKWAWFDQITPDLFAAPTDKGSVESTDASGVLYLNLINTTKVSGETGFLIVTDSNGTLAMTHKAFCGPVAVI